jgi:hypothetical protein
MGMTLLEAVTEWREARRHMATLTYKFERTKKGNEFTEQAEVMTAWTRLANAEHALMSAEGPL